MTWLNSIFGESTAVNLIAITVGLVLVLLGLFWVFRKIAGNNNIRGTKNRRPRLGVTEAAIVDDKRRLVLVRRDNVEHLVMIGGASDVLVESNIVRVQPATSAVEPIKTTVPVQEPVQEEIPTQLEKADTLDDVPPRSVTALASGAAATAAVVASVENALSKADDVPADAVKEPEFTPAVVDTPAVMDTPAVTDTPTVADTLTVIEAPAAADTPIIAPTVADTPAQDAKVGNFGAGNTNPFVNNDIVETELEIVEVAEIAPKAYEKFADTASQVAEAPENKAENKPDDKADIPFMETPPIVDNTAEAKSQDIQKSDEPREAEDVAIRMESISEPQDILEQAPSIDTKEEVKAPDVAPPFEVAAAVSSPEPAKPSAAKAKDARSDDMEDEMQKLLSELAGEKRG